MGQKVSVRELEHPGSTIIHHFYDAGNEIMERNVAMKPFMESLQMKDIHEGTGCKGLTLAMS
jgi:hypothetical protein